MRVRVNDLWSLNGFKCVIRDRFNYHYNQVILRGTRKRISSCEELSRHEGRHSD